MIANTGATRRHQHVIGLGGGGDIGNGAGIIGGDGQYDWFSAPGADQSGQSMGIGTDNATRRDGVSGKGDFIPGRQNADTRAPMHGKPGVIAGRRKADIARRQAPALCQKCFAFSEIQAALAYPAPRCDAFLDQNSAISGFGIFLQQDGIRPFGQEAAGENTHRLTRADRTSKRMPRRGRANHGKHCTQNAIRRTQSIAIHGRNIGGRLREPREHGPRQDAPGCLGQGDGFGSGGRQRRQDARAGFFNRQQAALLSHR